MVKNSPSEICNFFLFKTRIPIPRHFDESLHVCEKTYCSAALQWQTDRSELSREKFQIFPADFE
jgi:hypothetical protein